MLLFRAHRCYLPAFKYREEGSGLGEEQAGLRRWCGLFRNVGLEPEPCLAPRDPRGLPQLPVKDRELSWRGLCYITAVLVEHPLMQRECLDKGLSSAGISFILSSGSHGGGGD